ncbi:hypothetical protein JTB14_034279 [Gonioctena quinquepunctata]|nr:hypothetical protein JTB14_034279 [Gonioctena quinquepunctata]
MNSQVEKVEADSTTWWLPGDVLVRGRHRRWTSSIQPCSSTTLDEEEIELNWNNGRYMPEIVDDNDDGESDATIENVDEHNYDVNINDEAQWWLNDDFFEYVDHIF